MLSELECEHHGERFLPHRSALSQSASSLQSMTLSFSLGSSSEHVVSESQMVDNNKSWE